MWHAFRDDLCIGFWSEKPEVMRPLGIPGHRWEDNTLSG
jgi:hypothetical protein